MIDRHEFTVEAGAGESFPCTFREETIQFKPFFQAVRHDPLHCGVPEICGEMIVRHDDAGFLKIQDLF